MKTCSRCGVSKPLEDFTPNPRGRQGRQACCKGCATEYIRAKRAQPGGRDQERKTMRARGRALEALARQHPDEFDSLLSRERVTEGLSPIPWERTG